MKKIIYIIILIFVFAFIASLFSSNNKPSDNIDVFVIDSLSATLPDKDRLFSQFDKLSHGEAVSRLIGSRVDDVINVDNSNGNVDIYKYINALELICNRSKKLKKGRRIVVNVSLSIGTRTVEEYYLIKKLHKNGVIIIASAGNDGFEGCKYPAGYDEVISVAACDEGKIAGYSNNCKCIDIVANGKYEETRTTTNLLMERSTEKVTLHGTSFAAPRVTAIVIELLKIKPDLSKEEIVSILQKSSMEVQFSKCSGGKACKLPALAEISTKHRKRLNIINYSLIGFAVISGIAIGTGAVILAFCFIVIPLAMYMFRLFLPWLYTYIQRRRIKSIISKNPETQKELVKLVKILVCQDYEVEDDARDVLVSLCGKSVLMKNMVYAALDTVRSRAKYTQFVDERTPISKVKKTVREKYPQYFPQAVYRPNPFTQT